MTFGFVSLLVNGRPPLELLLREWCRRTRDALRECERRDGVPGTEELERYDVLAGLVVGSLRAAESSAPSTLSPSSIGNRGVSGAREIWFNDG